MTKPTFQELDPVWQREVKRLRTSCARYRLRANQMEAERDHAQADADRIRAALDALLARDQADV